MDPLLIVYGVVVVAVSVAASVLTYRILRKRLRQQVINEMSMIFEDTTTTTIDAINTYCPRCAFSKEGELCDEPDLQNICRYGRCTRFEEKRF